MRKGWDEEWYPIAISTEIGQKKLAEKKAEGKKIYLHTHAAEEPCTWELCIEQVEHPL